MKDFLFRKKFKFDRDTKDKLVTFKVPKEMEQFIKMFAPKFEEILGLKVKSKIVEDSSTDTRQVGEKEKPKEKEHKHDHTHSH